MADPWTPTDIALTVAFFVIPCAILSVIPFVNDYHRWRAIGPGGLPYNPGGYIINLITTLLFAKTDTKSLEIYKNPARYAVGWKKASDDEKAKAQITYVDSPMPWRSGPQAKALGYNAPQRERNANDANESVDLKVKVAYLEAFDNLAEKYSDSIELKTSVLEKRGKAMFLKESYKVSTINVRCQREVAHIHESDLSGHVLLSIPDAKEVIAKGWCERHRMTGSVLPLGYTFLYVPRSVAEVEEYMKIVEASIRYVESTGSSASN